MSDHDDPFRMPGKPAPLDVLSLRGPGGKPPMPATVEQHAPPVKSLQYYLPTVFPIPTATEFFRDAIVASPGAGTVTPAALTFAIPQGSLGIVRVFGGGVDDMTQATNVTFSLRVNGRPVPGWGQFRLFPGVAARVTGSADTWVELPSGAQISVAIINVDGAAYQVGANYSGWYWPEAAGRAWISELFSQRGEG